MSDIINRNVELELNDLNETIVRRIKETDDLEEKGKLIIEFITACNEEQGKDTAKQWKLMTKNDKAEFINSIVSTKEWESIQNHYNYAWDLDMKTGRGRITVEKAMKQLKKDKIDLDNVDYSKVYIWQNNPITYEKFLKIKEERETMLEKLARFQLLS